MSKDGVISGPYFHVFKSNTGKYGPEITPYFDIFHVVLLYQRKKEEVFLWSIKIKFSSYKSFHTVVNLFHATDLFLYPLKTSENLGFSDVFSGYR